MTTVTVEVVGKGRRQVAIQLMAAVAEVVIVASGNSDCGGDSSNE